ncbi:MAG: glycosyltransferase family 2 protein [Aggregatilineales bacterium]
MTTSALISIVMPTYNGTKYLDQAIESCLDQTYPHWELVVVDDASTDNTQQRLKEWQERDSRIRVIRHENNKGLPGALNTGIQHMDGAYFTWLSDDDLLRAHTLKTMLQFLEDNPEIELVYTDYSEVDENNNFIRRRYVEAPELLGIANPIGVCHLRKREVFDKVGIYAEDLFLAEDLEFWIRAFMKCKVSILREDLFLYRQHQASLTTSQKKRVYPVHGEILDRHIDNMHWLDADQRAWAYFRLAKRAMEYKDWQHVKEYTQKALAQSPTFIVKKAIQKALGEDANTEYFSTEATQHDKQ